MLRVTKSIYRDIVDYVLCNEDEAVKELSEGGFEVVEDNSKNKTDASLISFLRDYYNNHMPVNLNAWYRVNIPDDNLKYGCDLGKQVYFVYDLLYMIFDRSFKLCAKHPILAISTYTSKSVCLPVYLLNVPELGLKAILRYNFYDWMIYIESEKEVEDNFGNIINRNISKLDFEGLPDEYKMNSLDDNKHIFIVECDNEYDTYAFFNLLKLNLQKD